MTACGTQGQEGASVPALRDKSANYSGAMPYAYIHMIKVATTSARSVSIDNNAIGELSCRWQVVLTF